MIRTNFHLTQKQIDALREISGATGLPVSEIARRAIDTFIIQYQEKATPRPRHGTLR
ncbi:ribbon-helix-helix protein, CopG family [Ferrovum myxofaciens]|uniref:Ribbon-helix-helix protein, CopG family n=1 Tax=Ferrovum myxofaciens TaxID=416213 RepID=A0A9E6SYE0_9PROT|nr:ribbon-helix-helix protein, CopG family [Ferrovum myxofaciens]QKE37457.1 MAG: ribbon-helix-helix protein, CopG family [Ferrovum myxofaciens]QWY75105.1 MAG: ribbon-helix-helix protein, CopG family [Ferrovum myxofaciens]QWY77841.1 MAG: ribbon-helix-helix protein, CopG family [Ferrovum myxofaciens]